jgi:nicotinamide phosphoribosyltransferase
MAGSEASIISGLAHLEYFKATDTMAALETRDRLYGDAIGGIVPATEHAVMCAGGKDTEEKTVIDLIKKYPTGILSIVSDTWDYFNTISKIYKNLKGEILKRNGKFAVRPDSGKPIHIICGNPNSENELERKGTLEILGEIFGYTVNTKGYKVLNEKIGVLYGDGMTRETIPEILLEMKRMGWSSDNVIFGVGSYQYQYNTRDTLGYAMKATSVVIKGERKMIFKEPKTDSNKKSQKGLTKVILDTMENGEVIFTGIDESSDTYGLFNDCKETYDFTK